MPSFSRRDFLKIAATSMTVMAGASTLWMPKQSRAAESVQEFLLLCNTKKDVSLKINEAIRVSNPGSLDGLNVETGEMFTINLPFFGHTVTQDPTHPGQVVTLEKWGRRGALLDINDRSVLRNIEPDENNVFFGHAVYNPAGSVMVNSEESYARDNGQLVLRDTKDFKIIQKMSSYGALPHECFSPDQGKTLLVLNSGNALKPTNLVWIDWASGKLIHKLQFNMTKLLDYPFTVGGGFSHLALSPDNWLCCGGLLRSPDHLIKYGIVSFVSPDGQDYYPSFPRDLTLRMKDEALSLAVLGQSGLVAITMPISGLVLIMDYKTQKLVDVISIPDPRGVLENVHAAAGKDSAIVSGSQGLIDIDADRSNPSDHSTYNAGFKGIGSHMVRVYV